METATFLFVLVTFTWVGAVYARTSSLRKQMAAISRLESKVDLLLKNAGLAYDDPYADLPPGVVEALREGNKIEAIKRYRQATGTDLKTSKEFIEEVQRRLRLDA